MSGASIGRAALTIGGGIIGNAIAPGVGGVIGAGLGTFAASQLFPPEFPNETVAQPLLGDLSVQTSTYGDAIPYLWGTARVAGNIIWSTDIIPQKHTQTISQGGGKGGGGGPQRTNVTYTYSVSLAVALCRGPITGIRRVYADKVVIFDPENPSLDDPLNFTLYEGTAIQKPDPDIEAAEGVGLTPAMRGVAYVTMIQLQLDRFNNRVPNFSFEVVQGGTNAIPSQTNASITDAIKLAFDPETRLIWVTERDVGNFGRVRVVRGTTMDILHTKTLTDEIKDIEYTPGYIFVSQSLLGFSIVEESPKMFVGSTLASVLGGVMTRIDTHTFQESTFSAGAGSFSPAKPIFHWGTVTLEGPNFKRPRLSIASTIVVTSVALFSHPGGGASIRNWDATPSIETEDHVSFGDAVYIIDFNNFVRKYTDDGFNKWSVDAGSGNGDGTLTYHEDLDKVFAASGRSRITRHDAGTGTIEFTRTYTSPDRQPLDIKYHPELGDLWVYARDLTNDAYLLRIDPDNGDILEELELDFSASSGPEQRLFLYPAAPFAFVINSQGDFRRVPLFEFPQETTVSSRSIVDEILTACGIDGALRDTTALAPITVKGYVTASQMSGRQALEPLLRTVLSDAAEIDDVLKFVLRGGSVSTTILEEDMGATLIGGDTSETVQITRGDETELPNHIDVVYSDQDFDYNRGTQSDRRLATGSLSRRTINVPVVMTATKARQLASVFLYNVWRERDSYAWAVTIKYLGVAPTDVVNLQFKDGTILPVRVTRTQYNFPALISMRGFREDASVYTQLTPGVPTLVAQRTAQITVPTILQFLDLPLLRDEDEDAGFYIGASGPYSGWEFADLFDSFDEGGTYTFRRLLTKEAVYGFALTSLGSTSRPWAWDDTNTLDVEMVNGTLSASTDEDVFNFANMAVVGDEIIQFVNVTSIGSNQFRLSRLRRGVRGTDTEIGNHVPGDRFVLLTVNTIDRVPLGVTQVDVGRTYKAVSNGMTLGQTYPRFFIPTGRGLKPYNPVDVAATKSTNDFIITWRRRARVNNGFKPFELPLDESSERYEVDVLDGGNPTAGSPYSVTSPTFTYTEAQQISDFGSAQASITVNIYQLSEFDEIGRGIAANATLS